MAKTYDERLERAAWVWCKINNVQVNADVLDGIVQDETLFEIDEMNDTIFDCVYKYIDNEGVIKAMEAEMDKRGLVYPYD